MVLFGQSKHGISERPRLTSSPLHCKHISLKSEHGGMESCI